MAFSAFPLLKIMVHVVVVFQSASKLKDSHDQVNPCTFYANRFSIVQENETQILFSFFGFRFSCRKKTKLNFHFRFLFSPSGRKRNSNSLNVLHFSFSVAKKMCKFHRLCPARSDCYNIAHGILSCYKLQGACIQFTDKIWKLQLKYFSYKRDQRRAFSSTLICISKLTNLNERILKMQALIGLKKHISVQYIHQRSHRLPQTHGYIFSFHPPTS